MLLRLSTLTDPIFKTGSAMGLGPLDGEFCQDKPVFMAFCYPGFLPGYAFGFNDTGICFAANNVQPCRSIRGFSSSLSQSAKRLIPTTNSTRAAPGKTIIHHIPA